MIGAARVAVPLLAVALTLLMGNLATLQQMLSNLARLGGWSGSEAGAYLAALGRGVAARVSGVAAPSFDYWAASRVIPHTINEFPFWTFLFADLHPHLISIPFGLAVVGLALHFVLALPGGTQEGNGAASGLHPSLTSLQYLLNLLLLALALGALGVINTWDLPSYAALVVGALLLAAHRHGGAAAWGRALFSAGAVGVLAILCYLPFYRSYQVQVGRGAGWALGRYLGVTPEGSEAGRWLLVWGIFLFLGSAFVVFDIIRGIRGSAVGAGFATGRVRRGVLGWLAGRARWRCSWRSAAQRQRLP